MTQAVEHPGQVNDGEPVPKVIDFGDAQSDAGLVDRWHAVHAGSSR